MELAAEAEVGGKAMLRIKAIATTGFMGEMVAMPVVNPRRKTAIMFEQTPSPLNQVPAQILWVYSIFYGMPVIFPGVS